MNSLIVIIILFITTLVIKQVLNLSVVTFKGEKYIIPFRFRKCPVIDFAGRGIHRRNNAGDWEVENNFTLAEYAWAEKFDKIYFFELLFKFYSKISSPSIIMSLICIYFISLFLVVIISPSFLENNLLMVLFFWVTVGLIIIFRELMIKKSHLMLSY